MNSHLKDAIATVSIPSLVLESIFDDCDRYDHDETGGRIIGEFRRAEDGLLRVAVTGVIEAGPNARRSSTSFFQDGDYQAEIFCQIESANPEVEHLGNWHTHHVNGFPTLSGGDIATYRRIVNHEKHNLDFFYALLVVARLSGEEAASRYRVKHYILMRGDDSVYEVDPANVVVTRDAPVWPPSSKPEPSRTGSRHSKEVRVRDSAIIPDIFPSLRAYWSKHAGTLYWKGELELVDGSSVDVTVPEIDSPKDGEASCYQVLAKNVPSPCAGVYEEFGGRQFRSVTQAVSAFERELNRSLYRATSERAGV